MKVTFLTTYDVGNPKAGGGAMYIQKVAEHLAEKHDVNIISDPVPGQLSPRIIGGVSVLRRHFPGRSPFSTLASFGAKAFDGSDLVVDCSDVGAPWFALSTKRKVLLALQLWQEIFYYETGRPMADLLYAMESRFYIPYRHVPTVVLSDDNASLLRDIGIKQVQSVPPGVSETFLEGGRSMNSKPNGPRIVALGRVKRYKGVQFTFAAFIDVLRHFPDARLIVVGDGSYLDSLKALAVSLGISESVDFVGKLGEKDILQVLSTAHLLANTSVREGFGINVLEANACYVPCVGWDVPGTKSAVQNGETGILVKPFSVPALSAAILDLLENDEKRSQLANNAREWSELFPWSETGKKFEDFLMRVV